MKVNLENLSPWSAVFGILANMKTLKVTVNGKNVGKNADLSMDDQGHATLAISKKSPKRKK